MPGPLRALVLPDRQRRSLDDLRQDLDLSYGESRSKQSAFWTMLTLAAVIAACGILTDSTATVVGAMIIAPLSTPIMGIALGAVQRRRSTAAAFVGLGCLLVMLIGAVASLVVPQSYDLLTNGQISGRTSPGLLDLVSALATGFAGAVALARKDVAAVLPGVAIAISLVPPLVDHPGPPRLRPDTRRPRRLPSAPPRPIPVWRKVYLPSPSRSRAGGAGMWLSSVVIVSFAGSLGMWLSSVVTDSSVAGGVGMWLSCGVASASFILSLMDFAPHGS